MNPNRNRVAASGETRGPASTPVTVSRRSIDDLIDEARALLPPRPSPPEALRLMRSGAMLIDIRGDDQRRRDGLIPGAHVIPRNTLEWRCDPSSRWRHPAIRDHEQHVVLICDEGFQSSLAAANLQRLGLHRATDVQGGFRAWRSAGLPVLPASS